MAAICIGGICIPYSMIWPVILFVLREIYNFFFGGKSEKNNKIEGNNCTVKCENGVCSLDSTSPSPVDASDSTSPSTDVHGEGSRALKDDSEWNTLIASCRPVFVKFSATWCVPCKEVNPVFEQLARQYGDQAEFVSVDIDEMDDIASSNRVFSIPAILCFKNSVPVDRFTGKDKEKITNFVKDILAAQ